ncbi:MAG TPA: putative Fe-S cluster assembly protein SufT [Verrucomicrobiae bacterium]|jgi:probable FeS assembly SUF system protein SufT|nr:putative Fe-S cluster assembly protein SufT [Verrucomicrobiae bacterium]
MYTGILKLSRDTEVIEIPAGTRSILPAGSPVSIMQSLGGSYTISGGQYGAMYRIDARDADSLGLPTPEAPAAAEQKAFSEQLVWDELKTVFDPEIPVNVVDLGLIYECAIADVDGGGHKLDVKMSMTAPGCGMGNVLKADVENKLKRIPDVKEVNIEIVFEPPWGPGRMSEAAKLQLGFDLDYGNESTSFPMIR